MLLWLVIAVLAPAPKPVKNLSYPLNAEWQQNPDLLYQKLTEIEGVESISFSADKQTIYIKALQKDLTKRPPKTSSQEFKKCH